MRTNSTDKISAGDRGASFVPASQTSDTSPHPGVTDSYRRVDDRGRLFRMLTGAASNLSLILGRGRLNYNDFEIMRSPAGTRFYYKHTLDGGVIIAGLLDDVAEFADTLHKVRWRGGEYLSLAQTKLEIEESAKHSQRGETRPFNARGNLPSLDIEFEVIKGRSGFFELMTDRLSLRNQINLFWLRSERHLEERIFTPANLLQASLRLAGLVEAEDVRYGNYVKSLLSAGGSLGLNSRRGISAVDVGIRIGPDREVTAFVLRFLEGMPADNITNVLEFVGSKDRSNDRAILWKAANAASSFLNTDCRFLRPDDMIDTVRLFFAQDVRHRIIANIDASDSGPPQDIGAGTVNPPPGTVPSASARALASSAPIIGAFAMLGLAQTQLML